MHPDTAHAGGPNYSHEIRKMVYFRLKIMCCKKVEKRKTKIIESQIETLQNSENEKLKSWESGQLKSEKNRIFLPSDSNIEYVCTDNNKHSVIEKEEKCEHDIRKIVPSENSLSSLFSCWDDVIAAHSYDMWADLQGVKTLACRLGYDL